MRERLAKLFSASQMIAGRLRLLVAFSRTEDRATEETVVRRPVGEYLRLQHRYSGPSGACSLALTSHDARGTPRKLSHNRTVPSTEPDSSRLLWTARARTAPVCPASSLMQRIIR